MRTRDKQLACPNAIFWSLRDNSAVTTLSASEIKRQIEDRAFPGSVLIGKRRRAWLRVEVEAWCAARVAATRGNG